MIAVACVAGVVPLMGIDCGGGSSTTCVYGGTTYKEGVSFPSSDGCNTCSCTKNGVACTEIACVTGKWYATCGDPVCRTDRDAGTSTCTSAQTIGDACTKIDASCDPADACNTRIVCATSDPTANGCPKSRAKYKEDIHYLDDADREQQRQALLDLRLATYRYKAGGPTSPKHLGFIIDDVGASPAVSPDGETVNLYGFTSMAVATLQQQQAELTRLRAEVASLRKAMRRR